MKFSSVTLLSLIATVTLKLSEAEHLNDLFVLDCEAQAHFLPDTPVYMSVDGTMVKHVYTEAAKEIHEFLQKTSCEDITPDDLGRTLLPSYESFMSAFFYPPYKGEERCGKDGAKFSMVTDSLFASLAPMTNMVFPAHVEIKGCSYEEYAINGEACQFQIPVVKDHSFGVTVKKCPNSVLPFFSLTCHGEICKSAGLPCDYSSDCSAGAQCMKLVPAEQVHDMATGMMQASGLFDDAFMAQLKIKAAVLRMKSYMVGMFESFFGGAATTGMGVCVPDLTQFQSGPANSDGSHNLASVASTVMKFQSQVMESGGNPERLLPIVNQVVQFVSELVSVSKHTIVNNNLMEKCAASGCTKTYFEMMTSECDAACDNVECKQQMGACIDPPTPESGGGGYCESDIDCDYVGPNSYCIDNVCTDSRRRNLLLDTVSSSIDTMKNTLLPAVHPESMAGRVLTSITNMKDAVVEEYTNQLRELAIARDDAQAFICGAHEDTTLDEIVMVNPGALPNINYALWTGEGIFGDFGGFCDLCPESGEKYPLACIGAEEVFSYANNTEAAVDECGDFGETTCTPEYEWACVGNPLKSFVGASMIPAPPLMLAIPCSVADGDLQNHWHHHVEEGSKVPVCILKGGFDYLLDYVEVEEGNCDQASKPSAAALEVSQTDIEVIGISTSLIKEWNGDLDSGEKDDSLRRMSGKAFGDMILDSSSDDHPFLFHDCNNLLGIKLANHRNWHLGVKFPLVNKVMNIVTKSLGHLMRKQQYTRGEEDYSEDQFLVNFVPWLLSMHSEFWTGANFDRFPGDVEHRTIYDLIYGSPMFVAEDGTPLFKITGLPDSCSFTSILDGTCDVEIDDLQVLFEDETVVKFSLHQCSGKGSKFGLPAFGITLGTENVGGPSALHMLETLNMCSTDDDCHSRLGPHFMCTPQEMLDQMYHQLAGMVYTMYSNDALETTEGLEGAGIDFVKRLYGDAVYCPAGDCAKFCMPDPAGLMNTTRLSEHAEEVLGTSEGENGQTVFEIRLLDESDGAFFGDHKIDIVGSDFALLALPKSASPLEMKLRGIDSVATFYKEYADNVVEVIKNAVAKKLGDDAGEVTVIIHDVYLTDETDDSRLRRRAASGALAMVITVDVAHPSPTMEGIATEESSAAKMAFGEIVKSTVEEIAESSELTSSIVEVLPEGSTVDDIDIPEIPTDAPPVDPTQSPGDNPTDDWETIGASSLTPMITAFVVTMVATLML